MKSLNNIGKNTVVTSLISKVRYNISSYSAGAALDRNMFNIAVQNQILFVNELN